MVRRSLTLDFKWRREKLKTQVGSKVFAGISLELKPFKGNWAMDRPNRLKKKRKKKNKLSNEGKITLKTKLIGNSFGKEDKKKDSAGPCCK